MGFSDDLRQLSDDELSELLHARPELAEPAPTTFADLAQRAAAPYSIDRCARTLDRFSRQVIDALRFHGTAATVAQIQSLADQPPPADAVQRALQRLRCLALVSRGPEGVWRLPPPVARVLAVGRPFGLGDPLDRALERHAFNDLRVIAENLGVAPVPGKVGLVRLIADHLRDADRLRAVLRVLPEESVLRLVAAIADGGVADIPGLGQRGRVPADAAQLLSFGLLVPLDWDAAEVPREVALTIMGGHPLRAYDIDAPAVRAAPGRSESDPVELSPATLLDHLGRLLHLWEEEPPTLLKAGGVSVRSMKALAAELGVDQPTAARAVAVAAAAGLVAVDLIHDSALPTPHAALWQSLPASHRWAEVVDSWRRAPEEVGRVADAVGAPAPLRMDDAPFPEAAWRRAKVLSALSTLPPGERADIDSVVDHVVWESPARWFDPLDPRDPEVAVRRVLGDAGFLGLLRNGGLSAPGRALLTDDIDALRAAVADVLPEPIDHFTVQADLTAIAPGELRTDVGAELGVLADVESRGGATMLRFSEQSLRRAMDRGRSVPDILAFLERHARPTVPQPLRYLVEDVGRRHGQLRVGFALSYLRADDPALIAAVVNHRKLAKSGLRAIAPNVAVSTMEAAKLLKLVRDAGFLPAPDGNEPGVKLIDRSVAPYPARDYRQRARADAERAWRHGLGHPDAVALHGNVAGVVSRLRIRG